MSKPKQKMISLGRKKLDSLGIQLPILPMTLVGSLPKTQDLIELKNRVSKGFSQPEELERKEKMSADYWLHRQEKLNFDVLVDGEINRGDMVNYFSSRMNGFVEGGTVRCYGNRFYKKPLIKDKISWKGSLIAAEWKQFQRATKKPLKAVLTGPYTLFDWSFNEFYSDKEGAVRDITKVLKREINDLQDAGAKIIQIDEPAISSNPKYFPLISEAFKEMTADIKAYIILHHAYGDLAPLWEKIQRLPVDNFHLEMTNSDFSLLPLIKKNPSKKDITVGIIESHRHDLDASKKIFDRIQNSIKAIPLEQLWFSPDSGLKTRQIDVAEKKIEILSKSVLKTRLHYIKKAG